MDPRPETTEISDPFFAAVRRRHPDVDLVVRSPPEPRGDPVAEEILTRVMLEVTTFTRELWRRSVGSSPGAPAPPRSHFRYGETPDTVRPEVRCRAVEGDGEAVLGRLADELATAGWQVVRPAGGFSPLRGKRKSIEILATYAVDSETVSVRVLGPAMPVGVERARELTLGDDR